MCIIDHLVERYIRAELRIDQLREWARDNSLKRPDLSQLNTLSRADGDALIQDMCDWNDKVNVIQRRLNRWLRAVDEREGSNHKLRILKAVFELSHVFGEDRAIAGPAFGLGYHLWKENQFAEAVEYLDVAVAGYSLDKKLVEQKLQALSYLSDSLLQSKQHDRGLLVSDLLIAQSETSRKQGLLACGLRDKGKHLYALARSEAIDALDSALRLRRLLTANEVAGQAVPPLNSFLDSLATACRREGRYERAVALFLEMVSLAEQNGAYEDQALALSEVGYSYLQVGATEKGITYLRQAVVLAKKHETNKHNTKRWELQLRLLEGNVQPLTSTYGHGPPQSAHEARVLLNRAQAFIRFQQFEDAIAAVTEAYEWSRKEEEDVTFQTQCLCVLGHATVKVKDVDEGIRFLHEAAKLADFNGLVHESIHIRNDLAGILIDSNRLRQAMHVIFAGIAYLRMVTSRTESTALRQELLAGNIRLYELMAFVLSNTDNFSRLVEYTDSSRAQNLQAWLVVANRLEQSPDESTQEISEDLAALRANAVETEIRHHNGMNDVACLHRLSESREKTQLIISNRCRTAKIDPPDWEFREFVSPGVAADVVATAKSEGVALVYLYAIDEGVCISACSPMSMGTKWRGRFVPWKRSDRLSTLSKYLSEVKLQRSSIDGPTSFDDSCISVDSNSDFNQKLFVPLIELIAEFPETEFVFFPHAELATVPFWEVFDENEVVGYSVCPSLAIYRICAHRQRPQTTPTLIIGDQTSTLRNCDKELAIVQQWTPCKTASTMQEFRQFSSECGTIHVAAHGIYHKECPYHSGIVVANDDNDDTYGVLSQFLSRNRGFTSRPDGESFRIITCAELMTKCDFRACRLAILSSCESGLTRIHGAGEMTGLPTALLIAGAKTVVASLWPVSDAATAILMHYFWDAWRGGKGKEPTPARALAVARYKLGRTTRNESISILGTEKGVPDRKIPFGRPVFTNAFQCYGAF